MAVPAPMVPATTAPALTDAAAAVAVAEDLVDPMGLADTMSLLPSGAVLLISVP